MSKRTSPSEKPRRILLDQIRVQDCQFGRREFMLSSVSAASVAPLLFGSTSSTVATTTAAVSNGEFIDGFENGNYTSNPSWELDSEGGNIEVVSEGFQGKYALLMEDTNSGNNRIVHEFDTSVPSGTVFSAWAKTDTVGPGEHRAYQIGTGRFQGKGTFAHIRFRGGRVDINGDAIVAEPLWTNPQPNTWYKFEMQVNGGGEVTFRVKDTDERTIQSITRQASNSSDYSRVELWTANPTNSTAKVWFDDVRYAPGKSDDGATSASTFTLVQGDSEYEFTPLSNGEAVERFYNYGDFKSNTSTGIEQSDASLLFLWDGPNGLSLVVIHDKPDDGSGGVATFDFSGLPDEGSWVVRDEPADFTTVDSPDWRWQGPANDGGAFRGGLDDKFDITITPRFNDNADKARDGLTGDITEWQLLSGSASAPKRTTLDMDTPVTVSRGTQSDEGPPTQYEGFDPAVHGFGFENWAIGELTEHNHDKISKDEIQKVIRESWGESMVAQIGMNLTDLPSSLQDFFVSTVVNQIYTSVNQGSATDGHCYGMVFAAQNYYENPGSIPVKRKNASQIKSPVIPQGDKEPVGDDIDFHQNTQSLDFDAWAIRTLLFGPFSIDYKKQIENIKTSIDTNGTAAIALANSTSKSGHQVLAYDYEETSSEMSFYVYDPNNRASWYENNDHLISFNLQTEKPQLTNPYDRVYDRLAYLSGDEKIDLVGMFFASATELSNYLIGGMVSFFTRSPVALEVIGPDGQKLSRDRSNYMSLEPTEYEDMRYRHGAQAGEYSINLKGQESGEYTLEAYGATRNGGVLDQKLTGTVEKGEVHKLTADLPQSQGKSGTLKRKPNDSIFEGEDIPDWLPIVGGSGVVGLGLGAGLYKYLNSKNDE